MTRRRRNFYIFRLSWQGLYIFCPFFLFHWALFAPEWNRDYLWQGIEFGWWPRLRGEGFEIQFKWSIKLVIWEISKRAYFLETSNQRRSVSNRT